MLNASYQRAFYRECATAMKLSALPGFLPVFGVQKIDGKPYLRMMPILPDNEGIANLRDLLNRGRIPLIKIAFIAWAIADSLAQGSKLIVDLVHGDLKPENVLLSAGVPYLTDFGIARAAGEYATSDKLASTIAYQAPELREDLTRYSAASDIYAYGRIVNELMAACSGTHTDDHSSRKRYRADCLFKQLQALASDCQQAFIQDRPPSFEYIATRIKRSIGSDWSKIKKTVQIRENISLVVSQFATASAEDNLRSLLRINQPQLVLDSVNALPEGERSAAEWWGHGQALAAGTDDEGALESFRKALSMFEKNNDRIRAWLVRLDIATALTHLDSFEEADDLYVFLLETAPDDEQLSMAAANYALLQIELGQFAVAERLLQTVLEGHDHTHTAQFRAMLARLEMELGHPNQAADAIRIAIAIDPRPDFQILLGDLLLYQTGDFEEAMTAYSNAIRMGSLDARLLHDALISTILARSNEVMSEIMGVISQHFGQGRADATLAEAWVHAATLARRFGRQDQEIESYLSPDDLARLPILSSSPQSNKPAAARTLKRVEDYLNGAIRIPGDITIEEIDGGFILFELHLSLDTPDYLAIFEVWMRRLRFLVAPQMLCNLGDALVTLMQCISCGMGIATNRDHGALFTCGNCHALNRARPTESEMEDQARALLKRELHARSLDQCASLLMMQFAGPVADDNRKRLEDLLRQNGLEIVPATYAGAIMTFSGGFQAGVFNTESKPICGLYILPEGLEGALEQTPREIEKIVRDVRMAFPGITINSASSQYDTRAHDFFSFILQDRLDDAESELRAVTVPIAKQMGFQLLAHISLTQGDLAAARRQIGVVLDLDPTNGEAWVIAGWTQLRSGSPDDARRSANRALKESPLSPGAFALLAAALQELDDDEGAAEAATKARSLQISKPMFRYDL